MAVPRFTPRRRPRLRLVGSALAPNRHACAVRFAGVTDYVVEAWTFAEWAALPDRERPRPETAFILPGLGFLAIRRPLGAHEVEDVMDMAQQARRDFEDYRWTR